MISVVDVKLHASNPAFPLDPLRAFINSPSSVRIRNVPRSIGNWNITEVFFTINYPDNSIKTTNCVLTGGVYVGTVDGSTVSGKTPYGFTIYANGVDENENPVNGYVLGKGDVYVFNDCGNLIPTGTKYTVKLNDELPQHPSKGDAYFNGPKFLIYDGVEWKEIGGDSEGQVKSVNGILPDENGNVPLGKLVKSVNNLLPDNYGNVEVVVETTKKLVNEDDTKYVDGNLDVYEKTGTEELPAWEKTGELATKDEVQELVKIPTPKVLPDYLYQLNFDSDYEAEGKAWRIANFENIDIGGCSSVRKNNLVGRNYDYTYSDAATFVIKLPNRVVGAGTKYGSVGIATLGKNLTKKMVESGNYTDLYKALPGMTTDGINEKGLQVAIHLVPSDTVKDAGWTGNSIDAFGAVRYVLDTFDNAEQAAQWLASNIYLPDKYVTETGYSVQYIVSGHTQATYIVQDGRSIVFDLGTDTGFLTNYRLYNVGSITHETERSVVGQYDPYGQGIERVGLIVNSFDTLYTADDMSLLMESLYFTNAYSELTSNPWYSEFVSKEKGRTLLSPNSDFTAPLAIGRLAYNVRDRFNPSHVEYEGEEYDVTTWQTVHTVVYDLEARTLTVRVQEGDEEYTFKSDIEFEMPYIPIPTRTSDLINDSGFITESDIPEIPTKTSDLTNDSGFITSSDLPTKVSDLENDVPYADKNDVDSHFEEVDLAIDGLSDGYSEIIEKIPTQASRQNQLADKAFVNSSIATNTGTFKGTFNSTSELPTTGVNLNDYAFVISTDTAGNTVYNRYKYTTEWIFEYALNNSAFTAVQWATINGGPYAKPEDIPENVSDLTNDSGYLTPSTITVEQGSAIEFLQPTTTVPERHLKLYSGQNSAVSTLQVKNDNGQYADVECNGLYATVIKRNGIDVATIDKTYYQFDTTADLSAAVFDPNTVYVVETDTSTPETWHIDLNVTQTDFPTNGVMDCVLLVEDLTQIPAPIYVGISNGAVPRFFGDTWDALDTTNVPYLITFTVLNWDKYAANVFVKIQKQES